MAGKLAAFLDQLQTTLGAVYSYDDLTMTVLGVDNVFTRTPPKTIDNLPALVAIIGPAEGPGDNKEQRGGTVDVAYHPIELMYMAAVDDVNDLTEAYPDAIGWYQPLRNALIKDNTFNFKCTDAKLIDSTPNTRRAWIDGKTYFGHFYTIKVRIDETIP